MTQSEIEAIFQKFAEDLKAIDDVAGFIIAIAGDGGSYCFGEGFRDVWAKSQIVDLTMSKLEQAQGGFEDIMEQHIARPKSAQVQ